MWKGGPVLDQPVLYLQFQLPHPTAIAMATPPPEWVTSPHGNATTRVLNRAGRSTRSLPAATPGEPSRRSAPP